MDFVPLPLVGVGQNSLLLSTPVFHVMDKYEAGLNTKQPKVK